jgi:CRISPR-associated protein Cmr2
MKDIKFWQTKLAARLHDPAEKALVLLRDPAGHEDGTSRALSRLLGLIEVATDSIDPDNDAVLSRVVFKEGLPRTLYAHVQRADWWAAAADRPQWPMEEITVTTTKGETKTFAVAPWARVNWSKQPVLIHPLTGQTFDLAKHGGLGETDLADIKQRSFEHFSRLLVDLNAQDGEPDWRRILLAFWRFGPELSEAADHGKLGFLWQQLPADTRVPDHTIWDHLDLASAFAGAFAADPKGEAALLALSIGPVQPFIAAARSTSDLWAGSHLLSRLAWEAMRPVCEALGPDAILFPRLRGVPQVDLWLRNAIALPRQWFEDCEWNQGTSDSNPLFAAALPNRFVAVAPASQVKALAERCREAVRAWLASLGEKVVRRLLETAGFDPDPAATPVPFAQMREQLEGFPEVHWAAVPFSLVKVGDEARQTNLDPKALSEAMAPFFGVEPGKSCGFLDTPAWKVLQGEGHAQRFFAPNPGVLYPAVHDLADRVLAASKSVRPFGVTKQEGWRCSLTGETEWLTTDRSQLDRSYRQQSDTLWARVAKTKPAWAKKGEHLGALPAIKRLWPTLFSEEVADALERRELGRFVVSTHTMALAHQIDRWLQEGGLTAPGTAERLARAEPVALPRRLMRHAQHPAFNDAKRLPGVLEAVVEDDEKASQEARRLVRETLGVKQLEAYYALLLMDGDRMGQILSGDSQWAISYLESFHPQVRAGFEQLAAQNAALQDYGSQKRALSPNRHLAISGALNDFSLHVVRHVVEEEHLGRVIYAGGDDVLAMLPVADALPAAQRLRLAYSGHDPQHTGGRDQRGLTLQNGFAVLREWRLMRMMGERATASAGVVVAHHQAPLAAVLRELRSAEQRAKNEGGRDALSISVIKRSGGMLNVTLKWGEPVKLLVALRDFLADPAVSRRAVYNSLEWLKDLPTDAPQEMLGTLLAYQLKRQTASAVAWKEHDGERVATRLAEEAVKQKDRLGWLARFMGVAEFLAREARAPEVNGQGSRPQSRTEVGAAA